MIAKKYRLSSKDISYILRKGQKIHTGWFSIFVIPQYKNNAYHQVSPQISTKIHKRATVRNAIKRALIDGYHKELSSLKLSFGKFLILPNKLQEEKRRSTLATTAKNDIYHTVLTRIREDIYLITSRRGHFATHASPKSSQGSVMPSQHGKKTLPKITKSSNH